MVIMLRWKTKIC